MAVRVIFGIRRANRYVVRHSQFTPPDTTRLYGRSSCVASAMWTG